jgi:hypothetical protein
MPTAQTISFNGSPAASIDWSEGETLIITVDTSTGQWAEGADFEWHLDGPLLAGETGSSVTINADDYGLGTHTLSVKVTKSGESYSKTLVFTVVQ